MTVSKLGLEKLLYKLLRELEPVQKDQPKETRVKQVSDTKGLISVQIESDNGDTFMPKQWALAIAKAVSAALQPQLSQSMQPWFTWNSRDLTQFDTPVVGSKVTAHSQSIVTYRGQEWINFSVTGDVGAASGMETGVVLPISATPPSDDYVIAYEFVNISTTNSIVGAGAVTRFVDKNTGYWVLHNDRTGAAYAQLFGKFAPTEAMSAFAGRSEPVWSSSARGARLGLLVSGEGAGTVVKMLPQPLIYADGSAHAAVGKAGLLQSTNGFSGTNRNYYRNIKCYRSKDVESLTL